MLQVIKGTIGMSATKYCHPFLNGLKSLPEGYDDEIQQIREW